MPEWIYIGSDAVNAGTTWNTISYEQYCDEIYEAQRLRDEQMWVEHQELMDKLDRQAEDRRKYPLFFLKEGIV